MRLERTTQHEKRVECVRTRQRQEIGDTLVPRA